MIKKTLYFGNPAYLSLKNAQLVIKLPEVEKNDTLPELFKTQTQVTKPIEDIRVVGLDNQRITITTGAIEALLENNCAIITCDHRSMPIGLMLPEFGKVGIMTITDKQFGSMLLYHGQKTMPNFADGVQLELF